MYLDQMQSQTKLNVTTVIDYHGSSDYSTNNISELVHTYTYTSILGLIARVVITYHVDIYIVMKNTQLNAQCTFAVSAKTINRNIQTIQILLNMFHNIRE